MAVGDTYVFPGFLTPVLTQLFFPKPPTTFLTCFCRGERRKYAGKKSRLNRGSNSQPPGHEFDTLTTEPPGRGSEAKSGFKSRKHTGLESKSSIECIARSDCTKLQADLARTCSAKKKNHRHKWLNVGKECFGIPSCTTVQIVYLFSTKFIKTLHNTVLTFNQLRKEEFQKNCGKRRKCW